MKVLSELDFANKRVFVRADLDVPVEDRKQETGNKKQDFGLSQEAEIATRLTNLKETVDYLLSNNAKSIIIAGHIDRPSGPDPKLSTKQLLVSLEKVLGRAIEFRSDPVSHPGVATTTIGSQDSIASLQNDTEGQGVVLLENLRFWPGEMANDSEFARRLAAFADVYVNEAFGNCHRNHASMVELPKLLPYAAGIHLAQEVHEMSRLLVESERPFISIVGGAKIETKLPVIENLSKVSDFVLVGGELPLEIQKSGQKFAGNVLVGTLTKDTNELSEESTRKFVEKITTAKTIVWNGPVGYFEKGFEKATLAIAQAIGQSGAYSVVGGGDTTQFLASHHLLAHFSFISAGGGAMLEFLAGKELPGLAALE